jgi:tRNA (guanosine-2'-O-)-methyltransferase
MLCAVVVLEVSMGHRPRRKYIVRTPVEPPEALLPAGPPPEHVGEKRYRRFLATLARRQPDLAVVVENVYDAFNLSAVLRTCDAVGIGTVHLLYYREKPPRILKGVASSAQKWLRLPRHRSVEEAFAGLRAAGLRVYATGDDEGALAPAEVDFTRPTAILLGNENRGVSPEALALADGTIYIPMHGMVQSLNVTVTAGMILYEAQRQRAEAGFYDAPRLPESEWRVLLARWLKRELERG